MVYAYPMAQLIRTRDIQATDRAVWQVLWDSYLSFYKQDLPREITEFTWSRLIDPTSALCGIVAIDNNDHVQGFAHQHVHLSTWSRQGYCYLEDLYVDESARGLGVGRALIEAVYRWADQRGSTRVYWHTEESNTRARQLYDRIGVLAPYVQYRRS
jgi:GNAT superfamily N-acetyltransferase